MKNLSKPRQTIYQFLGLVSPPVCPGCGRPGGRQGLSVLCPACKPGLGFKPVCPTCGRWLPLTPANLMYTAKVCRTCRGFEPQFDLARALAPYQGPWRRAVLALKKDPGGELLEQVARRAYRFIHLGRVSGDWQAIVPVPAHRGHHQPTLAARLAQCLAQHMGWPLLPVLRFIKTIPPQHTLSRVERWRNLRGALTVSSPHRVAARCLLVDDVLTTGATAHESARALKQAGAERVGVLTLARGRLGRPLQ